MKWSFWFCSEVEVSDNQLYPTLARTKPPDSQISKSVVSIMKKFNWNKITVLYSELSKFQHTAETIHDLLEANGIEVTFSKVYKAPYIHRHTVNPFIRIVQETFVDTRIYVILGKFFEFVGLMDHLHDRGLLDTGEYFVVGVHLGNYNSKDPQEYFKGILDQNVTSVTIQDAFKYFIGVVHSAPVYPEYDEFSILVNKYLEAPPFNFPNHFGEFGGQKIIKPEASYLYDAVWLYAKAVDECIRENTDYNNGTLIHINKIKHKTYKI